MEIRPPCLEYFVIMLSSLLPHCCCSLVTCTVPRLPVFCFHPSPLSSFHPFALSRLHPFTLLPLFVVWNPTRAVPQLPAFCFDPLCTLPFHIFHGCLPSAFTISPFHLFIFALSPLHPSVPRQPAFCFHPFPLFTYSLLRLFTSPPFCSMGACFPHSHFPSFTLSCLHPFTFSSFHLAPAFHRLESDTRCSTIARVFALTLLACAVRRSTAAFCF